jgi:hypothetical protein
MMAKIVVGSPNLTQLIILHPGLGLAMLEQHSRSLINYTFMSLLYIAALDLYMSPCSIANLFALILMLCMIGIG